MKKSLRFTSLSLVLAMVLLLFLPIISSADVESEITFNMHGPKELVDKVVMKVDGKDVKNKTATIRKKGNVELSIPENEEYYLVKVKSNGSLEFLVHPSDLIPIGKDEKVLDLYLAKIDENIFIDTYFKGDKEIKVYGMPNAEFKYYYVKEEASNDANSGKLDGNGEGIIISDIDREYGFNIYTNYNNIIYFSYNTLDNNDSKFELEEEPIFVGNDYIKGKSNSQFQLRIIDVANNKSTSYNIIPNSDKRFYINTNKIKATDIILARIYNSDAVSKYIKLNINAKELNSVTRVSGVDRYKTSVESSKFTSLKGSQYAIVASGEVFADALVGGTLATQIKAPILLTGKDSLSKDVKDEITRLGAKEIYLLGGIGTVSSSVEKNLKEMGLKVKRLSGVNREGTAVAIGEEKYLLTGREHRGDAVTVIDGYNFADALSAAPFIGQFDGTNSNMFMTLHPYTTKDLPPYWVIGGYGSVPKTFRDGDYRFAGQDRYETSVEVAKAYKTRLNKDIDTVVLVDGTNFPDALSSSLVSSENNGAILLSNPKGLTNEVLQFINENDNIKNIIIVGGEKSVPKTIENQLRNLVK